MHSVYLPFLMSEGDFVKLNKVIVKINPTIEESP